MENTVIQSEKIVLGALTPECRTMRIFAFAKEENEKDGYPVSVTTDTHSEWIYWRHKWIVYEGGIRREGGRIHIKTGRCEGSYPNFINDAPLQALASN